MNTEDSAETAGSPARSGRRWKRWLVWGTVGMVALFGLIQLVPYGRGKNPPVTKAVVWPNAQAEAMVASSCNDCHSNLTKRWWATKLAPASWLAQSDVDGGRNILNFSEWDKPQAELDHVIRAVESGSMPPLQYTLVHRNATLSTTERRQLADYLRQVYATNPPAGTKEGGD